MLHSLAIFLTQALNRILFPSLIVLFKTGRWLQSADSIGKDGHLTNGQNSCPTHTIEITFSKSNRGCSFQNRQLTVAHRGNKISRIFSNQGGWYVLHISLVTMNWMCRHSTCTIKTFKGEIKNEPKSFLCGIVDTLFLGICQMNWFELAVCLCDSSEFLANKGCNAAAVLFLFSAATWMKSSFHTLDTQIFSKQPITLMATFDRNTNRMHKKHNKVNDKTKRN